MDKLVNILRDAGGDVIKNKQNKLKDLLKSSWDGKINTAKSKLNDINDVGINLLSKYLEDFGRIKNDVIANYQIFKGCKYFDELTNPQCLNDSINDCFNNLLNVIEKYVKKQLKSSIKLEDDVKEQKDDTVEEKEMPGMAGDGNEKMVFKNLEKCCLFYNEYGKTNKKNSNDI